MFEMAQLHEDALREYDELELCYLETGVMHFYCMIMSIFLFFPCTETFLIFGFCLIFKCMILSFQKKKKEKV